MEESVEQLRWLLTLDELTNRVGMSVRNVRFYTTKGLIPPPIRRGRSGYYTPDHIAAPVVIGTEALAQEARRGRVVWVLLRATDWAAQKGAALGASTPPTRLPRTSPSTVRCWPPGRPRCRWR